MVIQSRVLTTNYLHNRDPSFPVFLHKNNNDKNARLTNGLRRVDIDRDEMEGSSCQNGICIPSAESPPRCRRRAAKETLLADIFPSLKEKIAF